MRLQILGILLISIGSIFVLTFYYAKKVNQIFVLASKFFHEIKGKLTRIAGRYIDLSESKKLVNIKYVVKKKYLSDLLVIIFFLLIALWFYQNPCQSNKQFIELGGDAATYTSIAAALDHPGYFEGDPMFDNPNISNIFSLILVQLIRFNAQFTHNYGMAFMFLIIPHIFFQMAGFYILGRILFKDRFWAFILAVITFIPISLGAELWGIWLPLPRFLFQTFLPYLLSLAFIWKGDYKKWPLLMIFSGFIFYLHPFSGLAWGFTIWVGFLFFLPNDWNLSRKLIIILGLGIFFLLIISPYLSTYLKSQSSGVEKDYEFVYHVIQTFFPRNIADALTILKEFVGLTFSNGILPIAVVLMIFYLLLLRGSENNKYKIIFAWLAGIFVISIIIPVIVGFIEKLLRIIPTESSLLTRSYRYLYPLLLIIIFAILADIAHKSLSKTLTSIIISGSVIFLFCYGFSQKDYFKYPLQKLESLINSKPVCFTNEVKSQAMESIRELTPVGSKTFVYSWKGIETTEFYEIRYFALRPLVFHVRDGGIFVVMDYEELKKWYDIYWSIIKVNENYPQTCDRLVNIIQLQKKLNADYLFIDSNGKDLEECKTGSKIIFKIENYYLLQ